MRQSCGRVRADGFSLVELVIAVALLGIISAAALQFLTMTESTMFGEQSRLTKQQRSEAVSAYIYERFSVGQLAESPVERVYADSDMPEDLRSGPGVTLVTLFGNSSRFTGVDPRCVLVGAANLAEGTFQMQQDCMEQGSQSIVQQMNSLIARGVVITTGLEEGAGRCSISRPIKIDATSGVATVTVDDAQCLAWGRDASRGVPAGKQVLLPRFVAYDTENPARFHTSLIEPPDIATAGIGLEMPDSVRMDGGGVPNAAAFVDALANDPVTDVFLELTTQNALSRLAVGAAPSTVNVSGGGSARLSLSGPLGAVRQTLQTLEYRSPDRFFGRDRLTGKLRSGSLVHDDSTQLDVRANCGGQTCGTALRFDLGEFDPATGRFTLREYVTSVSVCGNELPSTYYGYCGTKFKFDRPDGLSTRYPEGQTNYHLSQCALANSLSFGDPNNANNPNWPYVLYSPKARGFQVPDRVTVYLYEQTTTPLSASQEATIRSLTENRYTLIFQFDTFDETGGSVNFQLNNIETGRNLRNRTDPFTFVDDPSDFSPGIIGSDGTLTANANWQRPNDGVVIPLRLSPSALDPVSGLYELRNYSHDPDGDGNVNPNLRMLGWTGLDGWNIRATNRSNDSVIWEQIDFNRGRPDQKTDIQLVISRAQRCPTS